jgi:hypothetical protein
MAQRHRAFSESYETRASPYSANRPKQTVDGQIHIVYEQRNYFTENLSNTL